MVTLTPVQIAIAVVAVIVVVGALFFAMQRRRTALLRDRFGAEYDRTVKSVGATSKAEAELAAREKRVSGFDIKPLDAATRDRFAERWTAVQSQFVDDPRGAVGGADTLLGEVMQARGYPVADFEQRAADLSVDHGAVVTNYRNAHDIAIRHARGEAGTEDLRQAMIHYRALFEELTGDAREAAKAEAVAAEAAPIATAATRNLETNP